MTVSRTSYLRTSAFGSFHWFQMDIVSLGRRWARLSRTEGPVVYLKFNWLKLHLLIQLTFCRNLSDNWKLKFLFQNQNPYFDCDSCLSQKTNWFLKQSKSVSANSSFSSLSHSSSRLMTPKYVVSFLKLQPFEKRGCWDVKEWRKSPFLLKKIFLKSAASKLIQNWDVPQSRIFY